MRRIKKLLSCLEIILYKKDHFVFYLKRNNGERAKCMNLLHINLEINLDFKIEVSVQNFSQIVIELDEIDIRKFKRLISLCTCTVFR